jgi:hypothetical protein
VGADVVDGALVAVIARVALIDVVLSAFACSAVIIIIIIIILKERNAGTQDNGRAGRQQARRLAREFVTTIPEVYHNDEPAIEKRWVRHSMPATPAAQFLTGSYLQNCSNFIVNAEHLQSKVFQR